MRDKKLKTVVRSTITMFTNSAATLRMEIQHVARLGLRWAGAYK